MDITALLEHMHAHCLSLQDLQAELERERSALSARDIETQNAVTATKEAVLNRLKALDKHTQQALTRLQFVSMSALANHLTQTQHPQAHALQDAIAQLREQLHNTRHYNEVNGQVIHMSKTHREQLGSLLRGTLDTQYTYMPNGTIKSSITSKGHTQA